MIKANYYSSLVRVLKDHWKASIQFGWSPLKPKERSIKFTFHKDSHHISLPYDGSSSFTSIQLRTRMTQEIWSTAGQLLKGTSIEGSTRATARSGNCCGVWNKMGRIQFIPFHPPRTNHGPTNRCGNCAAFVCSVQLSHVGFSARCFLITPSECCLYVGHPLLLLCITHLNIRKREPKEWGTCCSNSGLWWRRPVSYLLTWW